MRYILAVLLCALIIAVAIVMVGHNESAPQLAASSVQADPPCCVTCTPTLTPTLVCVVTCTPVVLTPTPTATPLLTPSPTLTATSMPTVEISTSAKKGVAGGFAQNEAQLRGLLDRVGASWFYSWILGNNTHWRTGIEFVPMIRKGVEEQKAQIRFIIQVRGYVGGYWLIGNEPDNGLQDNLSPVEAADVYGRALYYVRGQDPTAKFIMGGFVEPKTPWRKQFTAAWVAQWGEEPPVTGWHLHMYPWPRGGQTMGEARDRLLNNLAGWIRDHPGKECWVTEFGELGTKNPQIIAETMIRFGNAFEDMDGVDRYAFFWLGSYMERGWDYTSLFVEPWPTGTDLLWSYQQVPMAARRRLPPIVGMRLDD